MRWHVPKQRFWALLPALAVLLLAAPAWAHTGTGNLGGFAAGFLHPVTGADHVLAMVAVGLWGAELGMPLIWVLPVTFPLVMALGGVLGGLGVPLPGIETGIACSVLVLGAMVALALRPPVWLAMVIVGIWAVFHGYAHGAELPEAADPFAYGIGFVLATGCLHLVGIGIGTISHWPAGRVAVRAGGAAICAAGLWLLVG
ncbi:MAG: HupE/UreJ family protein [Geminicoccaceae bacterium]